MIKTNELRIGNFVSINNGFEMIVHSIFQNDTVYLDFIPPLINEADVWEEDYKDLIAIPLTEELLLKFGFERVFTNDFWYQIRIGDKRLLVSTLGNVEIEKWDRTMINFSSICKYVHQLQNLYFALTGSELVFSTEP